MGGKKIRDDITRRTHRQPVNLNRTFSDTRNLLEPGYLGSLQRNLSDISEIYETSIVLHYGDRKFY